MAQLIATLAIQLISNHYRQPKPEDRQTKKGEQIICSPWVTQRPTAAGVGLLSA